MEEPFHFVYWGHASVHSLLWSLREQETPYQMLRVTSRSVLRGTAASTRARAALRRSYRVHLPPEEKPRVRIQYGDPVWGPLHNNPERERQLRQTYFHGEREGKAGPDPEIIRGIATLMNQGHRVVFWADRILPDWLGLLWILAALQELQPDLSRASVVLSPVEGVLPEMSVGVLEALLERRLPLETVLPHLLAIRRHVAEERGDLWMDLSPLPVSIRRWCAVTNLMVELLPDRNGLDLIDRCVLAELAEQGREWQTGARIIGGTMMRLPGSFGMPDGQIWEHLQQLAGVFNLAPFSWTPRLRPWVEARAEGTWEACNAQFRLLPHGRRLALGRRMRRWPSRDYVRWAGGRMLAPDEPPRRPAGVKDFLCPQRWRDGTYR